MCFVPAAVMTITFFFNVTDTGRLCILTSVHAAADICGPYRIMAGNWSINHVFLHSITLVGMVSGDLRSWRIFNGGHSTIE